MVVLNSYPLYLILLPLASAFLLFMLNSFIKKIVPVLSFLVLGFNFFISIKLFAIVQHNPVYVKLAGFLPPIGINLFVSGFNGLFVVVINLIGVAVALYSLYYIKEGAKSQYYFLLLLFFAGINGIAVTGDIFNFFVFFEILSISAYALVGIGNKKLSIEAGFKYLIQGSIGSLLLLIGIGFLYSQVGTLNLGDIAVKMSTVDVKMKLLIGALFISGLGIESALFPLNFWLPDAHSMAPSSISAVLSGLAINAGLYGLLLFYFVIMGTLLPVLNILFVAGIVTMLVGEFFAYRQNNYKRMLAFSSTGQMGLVVLAFFGGTVSLMVAGLLQLINHMLSKVLLFLSGGYILKNRDDYDLDGLSGAFYKFPIAAIGIIIGALSLMGVPLTFGFYSKIKILLGFSSAGNITVISLILIASFIEGVYFIKVIQKLFNKSNDKKEFKIPLLVNLIFILFILLILILGVYPHLGNVNGYVKNLINSSKLMSEVLNVVK